MKPKKFISNTEDFEDLLDTEISDDEPNFKKPTLTELKNLEYDDETDSETEALQQAFADGILKPGLNVIAEEKKMYKNDVGKLKSGLASFYLELPWIEKLDIINKPAPIAPELAKQLDESDGKIDPIVHDDFKRESLFYRQAQAAILEALPRLQSLGIPTKRPDDYFAEMAKSDEHMQKVKAKLIQQKAVVERIEKVRQMRKQKKLQKALNAQNKVAKQNARKELNEQVKKFRKGERKDLSFLENKPAAPLKRKVSKKRQWHDEKYGFGGRKRNSKRNTRDSTNFEASKKKGKVKRPGKEKRKTLKAKKR